MASEPFLTDEQDAARSRCWGLTIGCLALLPALSAVWLVPWFVTQDGPAHLYNAHIIARSADPESPFRPYYQVRWSPLPNWSGHLVLAGLVSSLPPRSADRLMTSLTLVGLAASIAWLRWRVAGWRGMPMAALAAVLLALNVTWLLGFSNFLLGACLFPVTLGVWWAGRERPWPGPVVALWALVILGYFSHLVSLGLTVFGLAVLAGVTPGRVRLARAAWTAVGLAPLAVLGPLYLSLTREGGGMSPVWGHLTDPLSPRSWFSHLGWIDPLSLGSKVILPFHATSDVRFALLTPAFWAALALVLAAVATLRGRRKGPEGRRAWAILSAALLLGGLAAPDTLGAAHGHYLQQRVVLLGLAALMPALDLEAKGRAGRASAAALGLALALQSAFVWDYARHSDRAVGTLMQARDAVGRGRRVATLLNRIRGRFRANPLMHADNLLGVGTGNILWTNYETRHYYFPVQFRPGVEHPDVAELEAISLLDDPRAAATRAERWHRLLARHHASIDVLVVWGTDPALDAMSARWFETIFREQELQVLRHKGSSPSAASTPDSGLAKSGAASNDGVEVPR